MKNKSTKHALLASVLSIVMCFAMLIGSTFAWFTDEVKTGVNKIVAGNLDVEMEYAVFNEDGTFKEWKSVEGESLFDENALWEPGYTQVVYLKISNVGSLSLNYKLSVDVAAEKEGKRYDKETQGEVNFLLSDYLKFGVVTDWNGTVYADRTAARAAIGENAGKLKNYSATGSIKASEKDTDVDYVALVVYMPEEVGNEANHYKTFAPEITLGIKLFATQMVDEKDSFGNDYDKNAFQNNEQTPAEENAFADMSKDSFEVKTEADLLKFADLVNTGTDFTNKTVTLANDITLSQSNWTPIGTNNARFNGTFDGGNNKISGLRITEDKGGNAGFFGYTEGATIKDLTIEGNIILNGNYSIDQLNVGGICAVGNKVTAINCTNNVEVNATNITIAPSTLLHLNVGGIVGYVEETGTFNNCHNTAKLAAFNDETGATCESIVGGMTSVVYLQKVTADEQCSNTGVLSGLGTEDLFFDVNLHS